MSYSIEQINAALADDNVKMCMALVEAKKKEISTYTRQIDRIDDQLTALNDRRTKLSDKKTAADSALVVLETQLEADMAGAL
jgi:predicted  nucleic acid-binding Zn-ribbon protein